MIMEIIKIARGDFKMTNNTTTRVNYRNKMMLKLLISVIFLVIGIKVNFKIKQIAMGRKDSEGWFLR